MVGQTISNYKIVEKLGEGGMGVVYKALDLRLNRFLALKFLPPERVNAEVRRRFFQEAQAASALNHPNITHIYDVGEWEGADFIAMEFVEGSTVQELLRKGSIAETDALRYAVAIADAMSVAHAAGIIHRDLKPGNVMVTTRGLVKILDFGLAKLNEPAAPPSAEGELSTSSDTQTLFEDVRTSAGAIVGSPCYMSPEQVLGKAVDARSDIFSFGALLYEMLTDRRAFGGRAKLEVFSAILHVDPAPPSQLQPTIPHELDWVVARCLRKDPERRFQTMAEVKAALQDLVATSMTGTATTHRMMVPPPRKQRFWVAGLAMAVLLVVGVIIAFWLLRQKPAAPENQGPLEITRLTTEGGLNQDPAISPDGKLLVYASDHGGGGVLNLYMKQIGGAESIQLTHDQANDSEPDFSPDGTKIVFRSERDGGGIYLISTLGGQAERIVDGGRRPRFSPDGTKIAYWTGAADPFPLRPGIAQVFIFDPASSTSRRLAPDFAASVDPVWSPDGQKILFIGMREGADTYDLWIAGVEGGTAVRCGAAPPGRLLVPFAWRGDRVYTGGSPRNTASELEFMTLNAAGRATAPRRLTAGTTGEDSPSISRDGRLVFAGISTNDDVFEIPLEVNSGRTVGEPSRLTTNVADDIAFGISADGRRVVYLSDRAGGPEVWVRDRAGQERQLTTGGTPKSFAIPTPDGQFVAWKKDDINMRDIFETPLEGGSARAVCADCGTPGTWSPDSRFLAYTTGRTPHNAVGLLDISNGSHSEYLKAPDLDLRPTSISQDGRWMAFAAFRSARDFHIEVAPFTPRMPPARSQWIEIPQPAGAHPNAHWSADGGLLYFSSEQDGYNCLWAEPVSRRDGFKRGTPFAVRHFHSPSLVMIAPSFWYPIALARDRVAVSLE